MPIDDTFGDQDLKQNGKWFPHASDELELKIKALGEDFLTRLVESNLSRKQKSFIAGAGEGGALETGRNDLTEEELQEALDFQRDLIAEVILLDWNNLRFRNKEEAELFDAEKMEYIDYSEENAKILLKNFPQIYSWVKETSLEEEAFKREQRKHDKGN